MPSVCVIISKAKDFSFFFSKCFDVLGFFFSMALMWTSYALFFRFYWISFDVCVCVYILKKLCTFGVCIYWANVTVSSEHETNIK